MEGNDHYCSECLEGYQFTLNKRFCIDQAELPAGCLQVYDQDHIKHQCVECANDTDWALVRVELEGNLNGYSCLSMPTHQVSHCTSYKTKENEETWPICTNCMDRYESKFGGKECWLINCEEVNESYECIKCKSGYKFNHTNNFKCVLEEKFKLCKVVDNMGEECLECNADTYMVLEDGKRVCKENLIPLCTSSFYKEEVFNDYNFQAN